MGLVLIVDDAAFSRRMIRKAIEEAGHQVIEAANGQEGLDMAASKSPDCMMTDLLMPEMDGFALLKALGEKGSKIPVIVLSADIQDSAKQKCEELGAFMMLKKPPKAPEIQAAIQKALDSK
ncbi:MAG: response regulator [Microcoleus sp. PH2017_10_PVI_O_A]|uniref:response regulator n=1 Tax=unclassified Microcoleus TaxID=2642155 RepID=UPI001DFCF644|nr:MULTISPECIES: response regulator [unclassified Microcoleus]TAE84203.1 MAG: response regulator [Oscillatoriales cyanobacterium]MCC3407052.1 response regulator [Microcoleus sp. PH2017_10_PVI_O_A]MCC3459516.1 response regulator [Microcoleus sp. PH2017_11_PCY_U_A]MCC3477953.1 response regulator [Microcoleus sp. PH2017_12_PCY_D_A]MCC3529061.1 response regulator [Microcoleus sp. PH2017_21_RUC_O_A]